MGHQIVLVRVTFATNVTLKGFFTCMYNIVFLQFKIRIKSLSAHDAHNLELLEMPLTVDLKISLSGGSIATNITNIISGLRVNLFV
jgi:hypothetical protein